MVSDAPRLPTGGSAELLTPRSIGFWLTQLELKRRFRRQHSGFLASLAAGRVLAARSRIYHPTFARERAHHLNPEMEVLRSTLSRLPERDEKATYGGSLPPPRKAGRRINGPRSSRLALDSRLSRSSRTDIKGTRTVDQVGDHPCVRPRPSLAIAADDPAARRAEVARLFLDAVCPHQC
jgi:hypothetical protein